MGTPLSPRSRSSSALSGRPRIPSRCDLDDRVSDLKRVVLHVDQQRQCFRRLKQMTAVNSRPLSAEPDHDPRKLAICGTCSFTIVSGAWRH